MNLKIIYIKTTQIWFKSIRITIVFFMLDEDRNDLHAYDIFDNNRIEILVAGYPTTVMIDSGASISVIDYNFLRKTCNKLLTKIDNIFRKTCLLADGKSIVLDQKVVIPIKLNHITVEAELYVIPMNHIKMILGCDLLNLMKAKIDFKTKQLILQKPHSVVKISCLHKSSKGQLEEHNTSKSDIVQSLKTSLRKINLTNTNLNLEQRNEVIAMLNNFSDVFSNTLNEIGFTNVLEYDIEVPFNTKPVHLPQYKCAYKYRDKIVSEVQKLLDANLAEHAKYNKWQFPSILVSKPKSTDMRLCIDFRKLNSITPLNPQPPFNMDHFMCDLGKQGCKYFSVLDLKSAFNQVPLTQRSQEICTFTSPLGCIRLKTCPFGLKNLPAIFTKLMDIVFLEIKNKFMVFYLDDLIIFSKTYSEHVHHLQEVLTRLRTANLTIQPEKTHLFKTSVIFLGMKISAEGIETIEDNIEKVKKFPLKNTQKSVRSFLGLCNYYRKHLKDYSMLASPLYELTKRQKGKFQLTKEAIESFNV